MIGSMSSSTLAVVNGVVISPEKIVPDSAILCEGNRITRIGKMSSLRIPKSAQVIDAKGAYLSPGYIDIHVHGGNGADYMDGTERAIRAANQAHLRHGTTTIFPTTTTGASAQLRKMIQATKQVQSKWTPRDGARIGGIHLYGPFFAPDKVGCHSPKGRRNPSSKEYVQYFESGIIKIATCAAELPGAVPFYRRAKRAKCLITCGHSNANYEEMQSAYKSGMRHVDHFWCAMSSVRSIRERLGVPMQASMEQFVIANQGMSTEVIADGCHLAPDLLEFAYKIIAPDRLLLVTDANRALDCPPGHYVFGPRETGSPFESNGLVGHSPGDPSTLASSIMGMDHMVRTMKKGTTASLPEVIRMASLTPATRLNIHHETGSLETGKLADILILSKRLTVKTVILDGRLV